MTAIKQITSVTIRKVLLAAATLASLTALVSTTNMCFFWFNQPKMPESVRQMGKYSG